MLHLIHRHWPRLLWWALMITLACVNIGLLLIHYREATAPPRPLDIEFSPQWLRI